VIAQFEKFARNCAIFSLESSLRLSNLRLSSFQLATDWGQCSDATQIMHCFSAAHRARRAARGLLHLRRNSLGPVKEICGHKSKANCVWPYGRLLFGILFQLFLSLSLVFRRRAWPIRLGSSIHETPRAPPSNLSEASWRGFNLAARDRLCLRSGRNGRG